jgi:hypothetical protein
MIKIIFRITGLIILNYLVIIASKDIDIVQLLDDIYRFKSLSDINIELVYLLIALSVSLLVIALLYFFRIFSEVYLTHYLKVNYYFLINLVSISTVYLVYRVYGYSRFAIILYLLFSVVLLYVSDKSFK